MASLTSCSCPQTPAEQIFLGRDNAIAYVLREDKVAIEDLSPVTRIVVTVGEVVIDSTVVGSDVIWWTDQVEYKGVLVDYLQMVLGHQGLAVGTYTMDVVAYDPGNQSGVVWGSGIPVSVVDDQ